MKPVFSKVTVAVVPIIPPKAWRIVPAPPYDQETDMTDVRATKTTAPKVKTPFVDRGHKEGGR